MPTFPELPGSQDELPPSSGLLRPSWADPAFMLATSYYRFTPVNTIAATATQLVPANPTRIAIAFIWKTGNSGSIAVYPNLGNASEPYFYLTANALSKATLFNDGPIVCDSWWYGPGASTVVGVYEWITNL
jgi:hypothetical protein